MNAHSRIGIGLVPQVVIVDEVVTLLDLQRIMTTDAEDLLATIVLAAKSTDVVVPHASITIDMIAHLHEDQGDQRMTDMALHAPVMERILMVLHHREADQGHTMMDMQMVMEEVVMVADHRTMDHRLQEAVEPLRLVDHMRVVAAVLDMNVQDTGEYLPSYSLLPIHQSLPSLSFNPYELFSFYQRKHHHGKLSRKSVARTCKS